MTPISLIQCHLKNIIDFVAFDDPPVHAGLPVTPLKKKKDIFFLFPEILPPSAYWLRQKPILRARF